MSTKLNFSADYLSPIQIGNQITGVGLLQLGANKWMIYLAAKSPVC